MESYRTLAEVIGQNVRGRRKALGITQPELAKTLEVFLKTGWGAAMVSRVERGTRMPGVDELLAIASALNATPDELLDPLAFGDDSPVAVFPKWRIKPFVLRAIVRGDVRVLNSVKGSKLSQRFSSTERAGAEGMEAMLKILSQEEPER